MVTGLFIRGTRVKRLLYLLTPGLSSSLNGKHRYRLTPDRAPEDEVPDPTKEKKDGVGHQRDND